MSAELQELLETAQLQKFFDLLEDELKITSLAQLSRLKSSDLSQIGMNKCEVDRLKKCAKMSGNPSALSKLRKILSGKNDSSIVTNGHRSVLTNNSNTAAINGPSLTPDNGRGHDVWRHPWIQPSPGPSSRSTPPPTFAMKVNQPARELCKRSLSSSVADRPSYLDHQRHKHEFNPHLNACCKFDSEHPCEHYIDMPPPKKENLQTASVQQKPPPPRVGDRKVERTMSCDVPGCSTAIDEVLKTLSGSQEVKVTDSPRLNNEKAPLLQTDPPRSTGAKTMFDNIAVTITETDPGAAGRERTGHPRTVSESSDTTDRRGSQESSTKLPLRELLPKKKKPLLRITIPYSNKEPGGIKPMSAADERKIDEAIELAASFALKNDHVALASPRSSGSSKESLTSSVDSPTGPGWFGRRRKPVKEEKKTFSSGMMTPKISCDINAIFTPEAQTAYNQLVAKSPGILAPRDEPVLKAPSSLHDRVLRRHHHQRSSLSESDRVPMSASFLRLYGRKDSGGDWPFPQQRPRPTRMKSCGEQSPLEIASDECEKVNLGIFYHMLKNQKNAGSFKRSLSLSEDTQTTEETGVKAIYRLSLGGATAHVGQDQNYQRNGPLKKKPLSPTYDRLDGGELAVETVLEEIDSPPSEMAPQPPPPPLPPRMPLRNKSTLNAKPRQRRFPLEEGLSPAVLKPRSMSEVLSRSYPITKRREVPQPRDHVRPTSDGHSTLSRSSTSESPNSSFESDQLNTTHDSDDSVFGSDSPKTVTPTVSSQNSFSYHRDHLLRNQLPTADELDRHTTTSASTSTLTPTPLPLGGIKSVRFNARDLGIDDKADLFWHKQVNFDTFGAESQSETDLTVEEALPCRYETSDSVSYEDLLEFALDGGPNGRNVDAGICDEIRLMRKVLSKDVSVEDCQSALTETKNDVHGAIKLIKLKQLLSANIADKQQCKQALMFCLWNIQEAAAYLLAPPHARHTPDLLNV